MNVLFIIYSFSYGGAEKLVLDLSSELIKRNNKVSIAALYRNSDETEKRVLQNLNEQGINSLIIGKKAHSGRLHTLIELFKFARKNKADVIHGHCSVPMFFAKLVGFLLHIPAVCTVHSVTGYSRRLEKMTGFMASTYVAICKSAEEYMTKSLSVPHNKITDIYNAIDTDIFTGLTKDKNYLLQYGGREDDLKIINVARITPAKNQLCLLKALSLCKKQGKKVHLYLLGAYNCSDSTYKELSDYVSNNGLSGYVTFLGFHPDVNNFLINSDVFVMSSEYEGFSVAFLEAVISGLPVISTELGFVSELNSLSECASVVPQNGYEQIADLIINNRFNPQSADTVALFRDKFSIDKFAEEHLKLYKKVTGLINE